MSPQNNSLFDGRFPALPMGESEEGKIWAAFWQAQAEWTAKVAKNGGPQPQPDPKPD
jgi:hypothetical protein